MEAQKIDGSYLDIFGIVIVGFSLQNKLEKIWFFQETFLVADTRIKVVLRIPFFTLSNSNRRFAERELVWKTYSGAKALPMTWRVEIIDKKEFALAVLNEENKTFVVHIVAFSIDSNVHASWRVKIFLLDVKEVIIPSEYTN